MENTVRAALIGFGGMGREKPVADGVDGLLEVRLANGIYVSGWEERRVSLPVEEQRYLDGLHSRQQAERAGSSDTTLN